MRTYLLCLLLLAAAPLIDEFDLPLMPGLAEQAEARMSFDKAEGRIVETLLEGQVPMHAAMDYYASALPGLGWTRADGGRMADRQAYVRGSDRLIVDFAHKAGVTRVRLLLEPDEPRH